MIMKLDNLDLIIFDLDETLVDWTTQQLFPEVVQIITELKSSGYKLGLASYNGAAGQLLRNFGIYEMFDVIEYENVRNIFSDKMFDDVENGHPVCNDNLWLRVLSGIDKRDMLTSIITSLDIPSSRALFFDDQDRYINTAMSLGIKGYKVDHTGVNRKCVIHAIESFADAVEHAEYASYNNWIAL